MVQLIVNNIINMSDQLYDNIKEMNVLNTKEVLENTAFVPNPHHFITVRGAKEHNLKDVSLVIPKNRLVVFCGLSGSGKSSIVFDTIYAEGQRRYVESLSSYARQFLGLKEKPNVDSIDGLSPAISIDQKSTSQNPRSTVGTITEIYDYLRLLYAKIGHQHCAVCGSEISTESVTSICERILKQYPKKAIIILAPVVQDQKGWHRQHIVEAKKNGFRRLRINGQIMLLDEVEQMELNKQQKHSIEIIVDRIVVSEENKIRLLDSFQTALNHAGDKAMILIQEEEGDKIIHFNKNRACPNGHGTPVELEPRLFSFNSPHGACETCSGLGMVTEIDPDLVVPNPNLSIIEGCIRPLSRMSMSGGWLTKMFEDLAVKHKFSLEDPWNNLSEEVRKIILFGDGKFEGVITNLKRRYADTTSDSTRRDIESYMNKKVCPVCQGARLNKQALAVFVNSKRISDLVQMSISHSFDWFTNLNEDSKLLNSSEKQIANLILKEILSRLKFLKNVGLEYLNLARSADTLSGGEAQRIRLATQIGSGLTGVLYILDEPSIGLHQRDNTKLLETLKHLRDLGNTVLVVEHDEDTMREADYLVDIGPKAGKDGGYVVALGTPDEVEKNDSSPTGRFLSGKDVIEIPTKRRSITKSEQNNLSLSQVTKLFKEDIKNEIQHLLKV
jgi:excinuclease ABC subunit A